MLLYHICDTLSSPFSKFFELSFSTRLTRTYLVYHALKLLSRPFSNFLRFNWIYSFQPCPLSSAQLLYQTLPHLSTPFSSFFDFFIPSFHIAFLMCVCHSSIHYIMYVLYLHKPFSQLLISTKHWLRKRCIIIRSSYISHYRLKDLCVT